MKYEWTDWITHVPGQQLPVGLYVLFEFHCYSRNCGQPYTKEGFVTAEMRSHASWYAKSPADQFACMIRRYKLRIIADEQSQQVDDRTDASTTSTAA